MIDPIIVFPLPSLQQLIYFPEAGDNAKQLIRPLRDGNNKWWSVQADLQHLEREEKVFPEWREIGDNFQILSFHCQFIPLFTFNKTKLGGEIDMAIK